MHFVLGIAGGLALFLYGLRLIGRGLEKAAGSRLRQYLASMTANRGLSLLFGMVSTLLVQSSGASTSLLVSFAGAGLVTVGQCLGAVLGASIGPLLTGALSDWLARRTGAAQGLHDALYVVPCLGVPLAATLFLAARAARREAASRPA